METDKVCRVCLITDVKLHDLRSYPLDSYYESVIGTNHLFSHLPPYACFECAALVRKFYFFRQKCLRSQAALCAVVDQSGKAKKDQLDAIDRTSLHINSSFGVYYTAVINIPLDNDQPIKLEPVTEDFDFDTDNDKIKLEDHTYALNVGSDHIASSDDDEPLSLHKEKKSLTFTKDESVQEKIEFKEDFGELAFAVGVDDGDSGHIIEVPQVVERKKKRKLRADTNKSSKNLYKASIGPSADFEQYVNVITLTLEEQIAEVMKRKESANYLNSPYQCNLCYKGFIDNDAWNHHVSKHAVTAGSVECIVCKFRFKTKRAYQKHASNHEKKYACKSCPYVSRTPTQAKQHQGWHKGVTFECNHCGESFTIWTSYMSHVRIKHPSQHICNVCGYSFISKMGLNMHKSMMHKDPQENAAESTEAGPYCAECDVKFISTEAYKRHMVMSVKHTQSTEHINGCRNCGATFDTAEELRLHHRKEHSRKRPKHYGKKNNKSFPMQCEHCSETIPTARDYWTHFRRAHPDKKYPIQKNYICDICGKGFRGNAFLVYHKRTHFEERAYKCSQCDKAFYNRTNLQVHEKSHSDSRPYSCSVCFKAFKSKGALDRHFRCHSGLKPYECEVCGRAFSQSNSRKVHVRTVHLKQPAPYVSRARLEKRKPNKETQQTQPFVY
ncbi:zinc finger protein 44 isoform X1 [Helicoverpa armigera]|uniref:zinc finger protein 44 isoform X1 n=1 Tax=Helicoverpa armigera TaxID=29058 RepID=UPI003083C4C8